MRKHWLILPGLAVVAAVAALAILSFSSAPTASADNGPHEKGWGATADGCAACHRAHRAQDASNLKQDQETLCISCHDGSALGSDLNVVDGTDEDSGGALRGGGFTNARIDTDDPSLRPAPVTIQALAVGEPTQSKHSADGSGQTIWGYGAVDATADAGQADFPLACGKCHDPHGSGNYRILRNVPAGLLGHGAPLPAFMPDMTGLLADENPKVYTIADYWDVDYTDQWADPTSTGHADTEISGRQVGKWCTTCHTRYLRYSGSGHTDSGDAIFAYGHTSTAEGRHASNTNPVTLSGACLKCHVAHGTNATAGTHSGAVEKPDGTIGGGTSDSRLLKMDNRGVCQKCHTK